VSSSETSDAGSESHAQTQRFRDSADLVDAPDRRVAIVVARIALRRRRSEMDDQHLAGDAPRDLQGGLGLADGGLPVGSVADRVRKGGAPDVTGTKRIGDGRVNSMKCQAGFGQPLRERVDRLGVPIVEVAAGGEHLDCLEAIRRHQCQMLTAEAHVMKEMRGNPEAHG